MYNEKLDTKLFPTFFQILPQNMKTQSSSTEYEHAVFEMLKFQTLSHGAYSSLASNET